MRRRASALVVATLALACLAASLPESWRNWRFFRPIEVDAPGLVRVTIPPSVFGQARGGLPDVRVIDGRDGEVPFLVHARTGQSSFPWRPVPTIDAGHVPGQYTQVVVDTGTGDTPHNALELTVDRPDFFAWVEVAAGDDRQDWRILKDRTPIYRFERDGLRGSSTISYPETRSRWLRLRLMYEEERLPVGRCRVARQVVEPPELEPLPAAFRTTSGAASGDRNHEADLVIASVPASAVRVTTARERFHRPVSVAVSDDGESWREVHQGAIYRYPALPAGDTTGVREQLQVTFREDRARFWRFTVHNRNDTPIEDLGVTLLTVPRHVVFRAEPGRSYRLLYGNSRIAAPEYEMARLTSRAEAGAAAPARLGVEQTNVDWVSPEPWTERNPALLWIALGLAVAILGWLALRALR